MDQTGSGVRALLRPLAFDEVAMSSGTGDVALPVGTVTLLLADVEGSTRLWEQRSDEMAEAMARLDATVTDAVGRHEGVRPLEQGEGDSFVAAFARASDAVGCAMTLQRGLAEDLIRLRMGIHTGEVQVRDGANYIGPSVNRCARVRDTAHGGQVVLSQTSADLVRDRLPDGAILIDLGSHRLRDLGRPEHLFQLCHPDLAAEFPPLRSLDTLPHNLPVELTSFVGRAAEIAEVVALVDGCRLLTLTGSGGCGKTRLALQVGAERLEAHRDGVWLVELAPVQDPALVTQAIAGALSIRESRSELDALVTGIADKQLLVVLDNCEHLVRAVAEVIEHLLRHCPALVVLATSREPLGVPGEVTWRVPSLSFPDGADRTPIAAVDHYEAVQLFVERARRARPRFGLTDDNATAVAEICHRLDGIPLAIELAAARVRVLTPAQISQGLRDRFRLLTGGARTAVPRQQTLEASVEWSYDLLLAAERAMLRRLSAFAASFTLEAAEAVCADGEIEPHHVLDLLSQLVDKSLVLADDEDDSGRFRLLETVRHYAARRLGESGEAPDTQRRHFDFFVAFAKRHAGEAEDAYRARLRADYDNLRRALGWAADQDDVDLLFRLTRRLYAFWTASTYPGEACQWLHVAIDRGESAEPSVRARALEILAQLALLAEDPAAAATAASQGLVILRELGDKRGLMNALTIRSFIGVQLNEPDAGSFTDEAATLAEELGDGPGLAYALAIRGSVAINVPNARPAARRTLARSVEVARQCGAQHIERVAIGNLGILATLDCEFQHATELFAEVLPGLREVGDGYTRSLYLVNLVVSLVLLGNFDGAAAACQELAEVGEQMGNAPLPFSAGADGWLAFGQGDWERAASRFRDNLMSFTSIGLSGSRVGRLAWAQLMAGEADMARRRLDEFLESADASRVPFALPLAVRALVAREEGDLAAADNLAFRALDCQRDPTGLTLWMCLAILAAIKTDLGEHELSTRLWAAGDAFARETEIVVLPAVLALMTPSLAANREALGDDDYERAWAEGTAMSLEDAAAYASRGRGERRRPALGWAGLTPTEREVVGLVAEGLSNPDIAARMFVSRRTVTTHLTNIFRKLGVTTRSELAAEAVLQQAADPG